MLRGLGTGGGQAPLELRFYRVKIFKIGKISFFVLLGPPLGKNRSQAPVHYVISAVCSIFFRYFECNIKGEQSEHLCVDGYVYDEKFQNCDYPSKVDCGQRTELRKLMYYLLSTILTYL